jgi:hypothetical protein
VSINGKGKVAPAPLMTILAWAPLKVVGTIIPTDKMHPTIPIKNKWLRVSCMKFNRLC